MEPLLKELESTSPFTNGSGKLNSSSDFHEAANLTLDAAGELYGDDSIEQQAVKKGWEQVGILVKLDEKKGCRNVFGSFLSISGL